MITRHGKGGSFPREGWLVWCQCDRAGVRAAHMSLCRGPAAPSLAQDSETDIHVAVTSGTSIFA